ncbi:hypothetical protein BJX99DRAFT_238682 [Aspergillus californicus]
MHQPESVFDSQEPSHKLRLCDSYLNQRPHIGNRVHHCRTRNLIRFPTDRKGPSSLSIVLQSTERGAYPAYPKTLGFLPVRRTDGRTVGCVHHDLPACSLQIAMRLRRGDPDLPIRQGTKREAEEARGSDRAWVRNGNAIARALQDYWDELCDQSRGFWSMGITLEVKCQSG